MYMYKILFMIEIMLSSVVEESLCNFDFKYALSGSITRSSHAFNDNQ